MNAIKRIFRKLIWITLGLFLLAWVMASCITVSVPRGKYDPAMEAGRLATLTPRTRQHDVRPEIQVEGHTCGFHALSSIYKSYGMDPDEWKLRFRLGTDQPTVPGTDTTGTLQPDMMRVLRQDGFEVSGAKTTEAVRIRRHLEAGHSAVAVVQRSVMHWVVLAKLNGDELIVVDSLVREPVRTSLDSFRKEAKNILLISPGIATHAIGASHLEGIGEMLNTIRPNKVR